MTRLEILAGCPSAASLTSPQQCSQSLAPTALSAYYRTQLSLAEKQALSSLDLPVPSGDCKPSALFQTATVILRSMMEFLAEHPLPEQVRLLCPTEECAAAYRQAYNFWYAEDKAHRL